MPDDLTLRLAQLAQMGTFVVAAGALVVASIAYWQTRTTAQTALNIFRRTSLKDVVLGNLSERAFKEHSNDKAGYLRPGVPDSRSVRDRHDE